MKRLAAITAVAAFGLAPTIGWADCSAGHDDAAASTATPKFAASQPPAASKVPAAPAKVATVNSTKKAAKVKASTPADKLAAASNP